MEFLASGMAERAESSELLSVDSHSDGSHDLQDRLSGVFETQ